METAAKTILLIVDDESTVCRALSRMLRTKVDEVISTCSPSDGETILTTKPVTHLLCDHWFGPGQPVGLQLAMKWKRMYPSIQKAVVLTGTDVTAHKTPPELDAIVSKTIAPEDLIKVLELD